jgi:hypothetical protein
VSWSWTRAARWSIAADGRSGSCKSPTNVPAACRCASASIARCQSPFLGVLAAAPVTCP